MLPIALRRGVSATVSRNGERLVPDLVEMQTIALRREANATVNRNGGHLVLGSVATLPIGRLSAVTAIGS